MLVDVKEQTRQDVVECEMRVYFGLSHNRKYYVHRVELLPSHQKEGQPCRMYRVYVETAQGFALCVAKDAAIDCGSSLICGLDRETHTTFDHWESLWFRLPNHQ